MSTYCVVSVPVANLRRRPTDAILLGPRDDLQETQVLLNESLIVKGEEDNWYAVEATEQLKYDPEIGWRGYHGWVRKRDVVEAPGQSESNGVITAPSTVIAGRPSSDASPVLPVSIGTRVLAVRESKGFCEIPLPGGKAGWLLKKHILLDRAREGDSRRATEKAVDAALLFLGVAYVWGGRSMPLPCSSGPIMGVDCSGLVDLAFRAAGIRLPRNARDQWKAASPVDGRELRKGDLVFLSRADEQDQVVHVMLSAGGEQLIEAAEPGGVVRRITFREKLGADLAELRQNTLASQGRRIYFGRVGGDRDAPKTGSWF